MRPRCAHTNGVTEISASATRLPSCTPSPTLHRADSRFRHLRLYRSSAYTPCVLAALIRMGLLRVAHLRRACHHALRRRRCIVQTADSRQRRVTPRNPIRTTRSAEGAWGVGLHHRYALRRCATSPEAEWSDIAARRVSNEFWDRHRCRTEK